MMNDQDKKKNIRLVLFMCLTTLVGAVNILLNRNFILLLPCLFLPAISIPCLYFNYSLCKWENRWHSLWNERNACDGEPSDWRLTMGKFGGWALFIIALVLALIPEL